PQPDKRIVILSDLADGNPDGPPIGGAEGDIQTWVPLEELRANGTDCGITRADRMGSKVHARVLCSAGSPPTSRAIEIRANGATIGKATLLGGSRIEDVSIDVPADTTAELRAGLTESDAIAEDDETPVVAEGGSLAVASIVDPAMTRVATGGPPPI